jgi:hypothetical protein
MYQLSRNVVRLRYTISKVGDGKRIVKNAADCCEIDKGKSFDYH